MNENLRMQIENLVDNGMTYGQALDRIIEYFTMDYPAERDGLIPEIKERYEDVYNVLSELDMI